MRHALRPLPGGSNGPQPVLDVRLTGAADASLPCLIDTGTMRTRLPAWVADELGIDLTDSAPPQSIALGGMTLTAFPAPVVLRTKEGTIITTVWFCPGWNSPFGLLGQEGFLDQYRFTLDVAEGWFALESAA